MSRSIIQVHKLCYTVHVFNRKAITAHFARSANRCGLPRLHQIRATLPRPHTPVVLYNTASTVRLCPTGPRTRHDGEGVSNYAARPGASRSASTITTRKRFGARWQQSPQAHTIIPLLVGGRPTPVCREYGAVIADRRADAALHSHQNARYRRREVVKHLQVIFKRNIFEQTLNPD